MTGREEPANAESSPRKFSWEIAVYCSLGCIGGLGILGKMALVARIVPHAQAIGPLMCLGVAAPLLWRLALRFRYLIAVPATLCFMLFPLVIYPLVEQLHAVGRGSDQPDCIIAASGAMAHFEWPYEILRMWSRNPLSCGPGWVALHAPVVELAGYRWALFLLVGGSLVAVLLGSGRDRFFAFVALLALCPGVWIAAADGTDFFTFGLITAALYACTPNRQSLTAILMTTIVAQFRTVTLLLPVVFVRRLGRVPVAVAIGLGTIVYAAFLFHDPVKFIGEGPLHLFYKATGSHLPSLSPTLLTAIFLAAAGVACLAGLRLTAHLPVPVAIASYLCGLFFLPAVLNLISTFDRHGLNIEALGLWEGGNWIAGCVPVLALIVVERCIPVKQTQLPTARPASAA